MRIAVLSGKGGTGKTFIAANLAYAAERSLYVDCDVEEPNGYLFLHPMDEREEEVSVPVPVVDAAACTGCKSCVAFCRYHALAYGGSLVVFPELCHGCGGCVRICPQEALHEERREIGRIVFGRAGHIDTRTGFLRIGEAAGVPIVKQILMNLPEDRLVVIDCPPGSGCPVMESIRDADYCVLVGEPTLFSVHNLSAVAELTRLFKKPCGVVINKALPGEMIMEDFCRKKDIAILDRIPYDPKIDAHGQAGQLTSAVDGMYRSRFVRLLRAIVEAV